MEMLWKLRLKMAQGTKDVVIRTDRDTEEEARAVADAYVAKLASPAVRFVFVERMIVAQSVSLHATHPLTQEDADRLAAAATDGAKGEGKPKGGGPKPKPGAKETGKGEPASESAEDLPPAAAPSGARTQPAGRIGS